MGLYRARTQTPPLKQPLPSNTTHSRTLQVQEVDLDHFNQGNINFEDSILEIIWFYFHNSTLILLFQTLRRSHNISPKLLQLLLQTNRYVPLFFISFSLCLKMCLLSLHVQFTAALLFFQSHLEREGRQSPFAPTIVS